MEKKVVVTKEVGEEQSDKTREEAEDTDDEDTTRL